MRQVEPRAKSRKTGAMPGGRAAPGTAGAARTGARPDPGTGGIDLAAAVQAAQRGDEDAFRMVYRDVQPRLLRYLRSLVGEEAEDVAAEAWLQITRNLGTFRGDADGFRGWTATIARHRALDHLRKQSRRPVADLPVEDLVDVAGERDTVAEAFEALSTDRAIGLINRLPRDQAEAVLLRVVMGLDAKSAGKVLGKRSGAVRTAAYRGLRRLADLLAENPPVRGAARPAAPAAPVRASRPVPSPRRFTAPGRRPPAPPRARPPAE